MRGRRTLIPIGHRFPDSRLVVLGEVEAGKLGRRFSVRCDCGNEFVTLLMSLQSGNTKSCGCSHKTQLEVGYRFPDSRLVALGEAEASKWGKRRFLVRCDCGNEIAILTTDLTRKDNRRVKSCGCLQREKSAQAHKTHGHCPDGKPSTTWQSWSRMLNRCSNPNYMHWKHYGGRGITVCDRWNLAKGGSFKNFLADMGERPKGTTLGRYGDEGNYEPNNCKWMTRAEQEAERRLKRARAKKAA